VVQGEKEQDMGSKVTAPQVAPAGHRTIEVGRQSRAGSHDADKAAAGDNELAG